MVIVMYFSQWMASTSRSQTSVAHQLAVTRSYVNMILQGRRKPSWEVAARILAITHGEVTANDLVAEFSADD
tara:strand:+ start:3392 stop:3607 length:216 start_codon:yes stop_codon:yes gene_type:complete